MSTHPAAGNARGAVPGEKPQPCTKVWSSHAMHATCNADAKKEPSRRSDAGDYELRDGSPTHSQVNAQIVGTGTVPSVPMKMRHRAAGNLDLRARKDDLAHAHAADT